MDSKSFDRIADRYDATRGGAERARDLAAGVVPVLAPGSVLEVGVGTGAVAAAIAELGRSVVGVDLSPAMLQHAFVRLGPRVAVGDAQRLPVRTGSCDNVVLVWVLHVVGDPGAVLAEAGRVIVEAGRVIVAPRTVTPPELFDDVETIVYAMQAALGHEGSDPTSLLEQAEAAGLVLVEQALTTPRPVGESPLAVAERIETRTFSSLWDLDDETWAAVVEPAIAQMRALPEPHQPRDRAVTQQLFVFNAMDR